MEIDYLGIPSPASPASSGFSTAGTYASRLIAQDGKMTASGDIVASSGNEAVGELTTLELRVVGSSDDAEERASGTMQLTSSDLQLVYHGSDQTVGVRFNGVDIPQGATIANAYLQFQANEATSGLTLLTIQGENTNNAATFTASKWDISSRKRTMAAVPWSPAPWSRVGEAGPDQRTPDLASVIQEIVDRPGWSGGNALAIIITGSGVRTAEAYDGVPTAAPLLHVEYSETPVNQAPTATISEPPNSSTFTIGEVISFTGSASDVEDGDLTAALSWTSDLDGAIGTGGSFTRSDLSLGVHAIVATATDSGGLTGTDEISITVTSPGGNLPPVVSAGLDQTIGLFDNAILEGAVSDDGLPDPPGVITTTWSVVSGTGVVTFADASAVDTLASFSAAGIYVLELAADDGELIASDQVTISVISTPIIRVPQDQPTIQAGIDVAQDGDLVLVSPGTYAESLTISGKSITLASEFYTTQEPSFVEQTIIDGGGSTVITADSPDGPDVKIIGFTIRNGDDGIHAYSKLHILNNHFVGNSDAIDYEDGSGGICRNNVFENNSDDAVDLDGATEVTIEDNIIRDNGDDGIEVRLHGYSGPTLNIIIRGNTIVGSGEDGIQLIDYADVSDRVIRIERNLIQGSAMVGLGLMDNGITTEDFRAASIPERIYVFNNTFVDNPYSITGGDNLIALNNLFVNSADIALKAVDGDSVAAYNLFGNNGTHNQGSNVDETTTLYVDPLLDSDYHLQAGSPGIDAGTAYFEWGEETVLDVSSSAYSGAAPDLGAYESNFNQLPSVEAGPDQSVTLPDSAVLDATVTDDGLPDPPGAVTTTWSMVSGPGTVYFADASAAGATASFSEAGLYVLRLTADDGELTASDELTVSVNPALPVNAPPTVTISAPADDAMFDAGEVITFTGTVSDAEDGDLTAGLLWMSGLEGEIGTGGSFTAALSVGVHTIMAVVTDTGGLTDTGRISLTVNAVNTPPTVTISAPADGAMFDAGEVITFTGTASDAEDGDLTAGLLWVSSLEGEIGTGGSFTAALSVGMHTITAVLTDTGGLTDTDQISLTVNTVNTPPMVTISAPADGATFDFGEAIIFTGTAGDAQDGDLAAGLSWTSDLDGAIGTGGSFTATLGVGVHIITVTVTDSGGLSGSDQITLTVNAANTAPTVVISAPASGSTFTIGEVISFTATAGDAEDGDVTAGLSWTSDLDGAIGTGGSFTRSDLSVGPHTIAGVVTDTGGLTASDQVTITVLSMPIIRVPQDQPTIQAGIDVAQDGDLVLVSPGIYTESLTITGKSITLASEFYTTQEPSFVEQTIIDGGGNTVITVDSSVGPDVKIIGFTIRNGDDGIHAYSRLHILNNHFVGNSDAIDYEDGSGGICRNNVFENNSDDAVDLDGATEVTIEDNIIRDNGDDGIEVRLHEYSGPTLNIIIRGNTITGSGEDGIQLIDYPDVSDRVIRIERNLIQGSAMVGLGLMDNGDTVEDYRAASIPERIYVFNNTFVDNPYSITGGDNLIALNNLFVNSADIALKAVDGDSVAAYNLFWNNGTHNQGSNVDETTTLYVDPLLDSDYQLQAGSPGIDAGTAYFEWGGETVLDVSSSAYSGAAPDLGAYESNFVWLPIILRATGAPFLDS